MLQRLIRLLHGIFPQHTTAILALRDESLHVHHHSFKAISRMRCLRRKLLLLNPVEVLPLATPTRCWALFPIIVHERLESNWVFLLILQILALPLPICILLRTFDVLATAQAPSFLLPHAPSSSLLFAKFPANPAVHLPHILKRLLDFYFEFCISASHGSHQRIGGFRGGRTLRAPRCSTLKLAQHEADNEYTNAKSWWC